MILWFVNLRVSNTGWVYDTPKISLPMTTYLFCESGCLYVPAKLWEDFSTITTHELA